jgi:5-methylthioadenosine/S-adenosylhomocysteine deaminase
MKISVGSVLPYKDLTKAGCSISLGTDGCASNNNLDMFETMKFASLGQKMYSNDPTVMPAQESFDMATKYGAAALRLNAGEIKEGALADIILIDLQNPHFVPNHNLIANIVYSANGSCVDTTICDGNILMKNSEVADEDNILRKASEVAADLIKRSQKG